MRNKIIAALATLALLLGGGMAAASATEPTPEVCVPSPEQPAVPPNYSEPWTQVIEHPAVTEEGWQRYSYKGKWDSDTQAPPFPDPKWQANVAGDPHGIGVEGAYWRSHGNKGKGDWFYLERTVVVITQAWTEVIEHPAVQTDPGKPAVPAVTCPENPEPTPTDPPTTEPPVVIPPDSDGEPTQPEPEPKPKPTPIKVKPKHTFYDGYNPPAGELG